MNAVLDHLAINWGNWASVAGLFASLGSYVKAKAAATAASDVRQAIRTRALADDLGYCSSSAEQLLDFIRQGRFEAATVRSSDLHQRISYYLRRWHDKLRDDDSKRIQDAREKARSVSNALESALTDSSKRRIVRTCREIIEILSEQHGSAVNVAER